MTPWTPEDVVRHNKQVKSPKRKRQWSDVANKVLQETGNEGRAIREANAVANPKTAGRRRNMK